MAKKLTVLNQLRPKITSQKLVDLETIVGRMSKNTTYNTEEMYSMLRLYVKEANAALAAAEEIRALV